MLIPCGEGLCQGFDSGESERHYRLRQGSGDDVGLHRQGRNAVAPPDQGIFLPVFEGRKLTERNCSPARQRHLHGAQGIKRDTLFIRRTCDDIDQIDIVAHLGNGGAGYDGIQNAGQCLRAEAQQARLILVDTNAHLAGGLDPVKIDLFGFGIGCDDLGELESDLAHLIYVRSADAILHGPSDRRPKFKRVDPRNCAWKLLSQDLFQLQAKALACRNVLCNDDRLA